MSKPDRTEKVVEAMTEIAKDIQGSRLFDYNGKTLYKTKDKEALVSAILKNK